MITTVVALTVLLVVGVFVFIKKSTTPVTKPDPSANKHLTELLEKTGKLQQEKKLEEAEAACKEALQISREQAKKNPAYLAQIAATLNNLANIYSDTRRHKEAESAYNEALEIYRQQTKSDPKWQLYVARTLSNMATLYLLTRQSGRAGKMADEAVSILRKSLKETGEHGNDLAKALLVLSYVFTEQTGREEDVRVCAREAERSATDEQIKKTARKLIEKHGG